MKLIKKKIKLLWYKLLKKPPPLEHIVLEKNSKSYIPPMK